MPQAPSPTGRLTVAWCRDPSQAPAVARLFAAQAEPSYISHSELQGGRAAAVGRWADDIEARIAREAAAACSPEGGGAKHLALLLDGVDLAGFAFVSFAEDAPVPYATLEDVLIAPAHRGRGAGRLVLDWIAAECRARNCRRLFLESGSGNHGAHRFFADRGFAQTSVVMMRDLGDLPAGP